MDDERRTRVEDLMSTPLLTIGRDATVVEAAHAEGMLVIPWTVNDPSTMKRLLRDGVDGLITDYPDRGRQVLQSRQ